MQARRAGQANAMGDEARFDGDDDDDYDEDEYEYEEFGDCAIISEKVEELECDLCLADEVEYDTRAGLTWIREDLMMDTRAGSFFLRAKASDAIRMDPVEEADKGRR